VNLQLGLPDNLSFEFAFGGIFLFAFEFAVNIPIYKRR
jgi:hypothetical protein